MSEHEGEGLLDSYRCLGNDWLPGAESASAGAGKLPGAAHKLGGDGDGDDDGDGEGLLHRAQRDTEEEMEADSGGSGAYLLSASRVTSNSSDCTDTTSAACSSSSDSSDNDGDDDGYMTYKGGVGTEEPNYLNSQWATADAPGGEVQRPQARRAQPVVPPSSPSSSSTLLPVPQRAAQAVAKAQHGLRATRSRLSINSLPNLLKEKTDELDLDYREINVKELDLEEKPVGKYVHTRSPRSPPQIAYIACVCACACACACVVVRVRVRVHRGAFGTIYKGSWRGAKVRSSVISFFIASR